MIGCAGAARLHRLSPRVITCLLSFFLDSPASRPPPGAAASCSFSALASIVRGSEGSGRILLRGGTAIVTFALGSFLPFIPVVRRLCEHASSSTGNDRPIDRPGRRGREYRAIARCGNAKRSIVGHRTFRCELIRLFGAFGVALERRGRQCMDTYGQWYQDRSVCVR